MLAALKDTMTELLGSKKFLMLIATVIAAGAARVGWNVDPNAIMPYLGLAAAAIVAQGIADHGKEAAKIAATANFVTNSSLKPAERSTAMSKLGLMLVLIALASCSAAQKQAELATAEACGLSQGEQLVGSVAKDLGSANWQAQLESDATLVGVAESALTCLVEIAVAVEQAASSGSASTAAGPNPVVEHGKAWLTTHGIKR